MYRGVDILFTNSPRSFYDLQIVICESLHYYMVKRRKTEIQTEKVFGLDVHPLLYIICGYIWTLGFGIMFNQGKVGSINNIVHNI